MSDSQLTNDIRDSIRHLESFTVESLWLRYAEAHTIPEIRRVVTQLVGEGVLVAEGEVYRKVKEATNA
jgi:hypothetical protein